MAAEKIALSFRASREICFFFLPNQTTADFSPDEAGFEMTSQGNWQLRRPRHTTSQAIDEVVDNIQHWRGLQVIFVPASAPNGDLHICTLNIDAQYRNSK